MAITEGCQAALIDELLRLFHKASKKDIQKIRKGETKLMAARLVYKGRVAWGSNIRKLDNLYRPERGRASARSRGTPAGRTSIVQNFYVGVT